MSSYLPKSINDPSNSLIIKGGEGRKILEETNNGFKLEALNSTFVLDKAKTCQ